MYKILLYVIFAFVCVVGVGSLASANIQPYSIPTKEAEKYNNQPWSIPTQAVLAFISPKIESGLTKSQQLVLDTIKRKCVDFEVNCDLAIKIAKAESNFKNVPNYKYTDEKGKFTAYGIFQILRSTYKQFCGNPNERMDIDKNIECGLKIMQNSGYQHWSESEVNWKLATADV